MVFNSLRIILPRDHAYAAIYIAYYKDLLYVSDIEIICLVYNKIYDDSLYGLHIYVVTYNDPKEIYNCKILHLILQHHSDLSLH